MNRLATLPRSATSKLHAAHLSPKYVHVDTGEIITAMESQGFVVASAQGNNSPFSRHMVDFRLPTMPEINGAVPRMLLINSHDGSTRAKIMLGVYRFVCSNGMVVGTSFMNESSRHIGNEAEQLIERMMLLAKNTGPLFDQIDRWTKKELTAQQQNNFAKFASALRYNDPNRFPVEELLRVRRPEDEGNDLWRIFNRVQEATVSGGAIGLTAIGRRTQSRALTEVGANISYNSALWSLAEEFAAA